MVQNNVARQKWKERESLERCQSASQSTDDGMPLAPAESRQVFSTNITIEYHALISSPCSLGNACSPSAAISGLVPVMAVDTMPADSLRLPWPGNDQV